MIELIELVLFHKRLNNASGNSHPELLFSEGGKLHQLYLLISHGKATSNEKACQLIYGDKVKTTNSTYRKLKSRFVAALHSSLSGLEPKILDTSKRSRAIFETDRNTMLSQLAMAEDHQQFALSLIQKTISLCRRYQFYDQLIINLRLLSVHYSLLGKRRLLSTCERELNATLIIYDNEIKIENEFYKLAQHFRRSLSLNKKLIKVSNLAFERARVRINRKHSFNGMLFYYRIGFINYQLTQNYSLLYAVCTRYETFIQKSVFANHKAFKSLGSMLKLTALTFLKRYKEGFEEGEKGSMLFKKGGYNWNQYQKQFFLLACKANNLSKANEIFQQAVRQEGFETKTNAVKDFWHLSETYLVFMNNYEASKLPAHVRNFLLLEVVFSADKKGFMILLKTCLILFTIYENEFEAAAELIKQLMKFVEQHVKKSTAERTVLFCRILNAIANHDFYPRQFNVHVKKNVKKMLASKPGSFRNYYTEEIIPYEQLLQKILNHLKKQKRNVIADNLWKEATISSKKIAATNQQK